MRKKVLLVLFCLVFMIGMKNSVAAAAMVVVEGYGDNYPHYMNMSVAPEIKDEIIMVSLQDLADEMGWRVAANLNTDVISVGGNGNLVQIQIGSRKALINEVEEDMPGTPYLSGKTIMIPLKYMAEAMGYHFTTSNIWNNLNQVYVTPYNLISDAELAQVSDVNFTESIDSDGFVYLKLKSEGKTPGGIGIDNSIWDVLQVYGVPRGPERTLNYPGDWSGTLEYWGTFVPNSGMGTFYEFTFEHGLLVDLTICC